MHMPAATTIIVLLGQGRQVSLRGTARLHVREQEKKKSRKRKGKRWREEKRETGKEEKAEKERGGENRMCLLWVGKGTYKDICQTNIQTEQSKKRYN